MNHSLRRFDLFSPLALQTLVWPGTRGALALFGRLEVKGLERLKPLEEGLRKGEGVIFAANHGSELDPILLPASLPFLSPFMPIFYVSREGKFYENAGPIGRLLYGGWFFRLWGAHAVKVGLKDFEASLATHIDLVARGKSVLIFPEGGIPKPDEIRTKPAKGGVAYLSERTGRPVVPIALSGAYRIGWRDFLSRKRRIAIEFLDPIYPDGRGDYAAHAAVILEAIRSRVA